MYGIDGSRASAIEDCIEPASMAESFQANSSQPHTSNLIRVSSPLGKDELSATMNPKSDMFH
jgi:hypothetical protein